MKIRIQDFGPIRDFTFDLDKDIHLLYGKNGTGKSYAICCVYSILRNLFAGFVRPRAFLHSEFISLKNFNDAINRLVTTDGQSDINLTKAAEDVLKLAFSNGLRHIEDAMLSAYGSLSNLNNEYSSNQFNVSIYTEDFLISFKNEDNKLEVAEFKLHKEVRLVGSKDKFTCYHGEEVLLQNSSDSIRVLLARVCDIILLSSKFKVNLGTSDLYFLPASRSGLYQGLNSFGPIIAELSKQRHLIKRKIELPTLSETVSDYYLFLASVEKLELNQALKKITESLERNILNGKVNYSIDNQKITFRPGGTELTLDLVAVSSMVAELSPIVTYLKYVIKDHNNEEVLNKENRDSNIEDSCDILFIEEPEAHLHPEAQVKLMEILAELPKHNIKVVMTSHSNYMFNKLTNLILEKKVDPDKVATYHMVMTDKGSVVQDDMRVTDEGIEDSNFVTVAEQLYEERMQLLDEIEE